VTHVVVAGRQLPAFPFIAPGATLGVVGGGQLGRMFVQTAQRMGYRTAVLDPDPQSPAGGIAHRHFVVDWHDSGALDALGAEAAAVTTEFENVPADALVRLATHCRVAPAGRAVAVCQDRAREKMEFERCRVPSAPHAAIDRLERLQSVDPDLLPGILKTARLGYDGKGQVRVQTMDELRAAWQMLGAVPCVLERLLPLAAEISVIVARGGNGETVGLPVQHNLHRDGILAVTQVPAPGIDVELAAAASAAARDVVESLDYVGVLCVEFFVLDDGRLVANEMAPRPHNSGHYSLDACDLSQFELQVRTLTGAPLVMPWLHSSAVMLNLMGDLWLREGPRPVEPDWAGVLALPGAHLHLYGKAEPRTGRKMGHLTFTAASGEAAGQAARAAAERLGIDAW